MISLKQSIEQDAEQLLIAALSSYRATLAAMGEAASEVDSATGEPLQQALHSLSNSLADVSADRISETHRSIEQELKIWATHAADVFGNKANGIQDVLLIAGTAAQQVGERTTHHAKRFTEFSERLSATSKLNDLKIIRHSIGQHSADLKRSRTARPPSRSSVLKSRPTNRDWKRWSIWRRMIP